MDSDEYMLRNSLGVEATRDIVQFVPYSKYKHNPLELAKQTLEEVPKQVFPSFFETFSLTTSFIVFGIYENEWDRAR